MIEPIKVKCKVCGRAANATEFTLDTVYKMMACPMCVRDRRNKETVKKGSSLEAASQTQGTSTNPGSSTAFGAQGAARPQSSLSSSAAGPIPAKLSDGDDKELEEMYKRKQERLQKEKDALQRVQKIDGEKVKYTCPKCKYAFIYSIIRKMPNKCPYCDNPVVKFVV